MGFELEEVLPPPEPAPALTITQPAAESEVMHRCAECWALYPPEALSETLRLCVDCLAERRGRRKK